MSGSAGAHDGEVGTGRGKDVRPIGIFDSGIGGLTVFHAIADALPGESLVYLGDSARVPYGTKSPETVIRYARQAARYLEAHAAKLLVVACNTASAVAIEPLSEALEIPVIGVIEPGARAAVEATKGRIGVIATEGTVRSGAYSREIHRIDSSIDVIESACPLFVPLAEEGWGDTDVCRQVAEIYLEPLVRRDIDTLVLGCTHYPILRNTIAGVVGSSITIIDSAVTTANLVRATLRANGIQAESSRPEYHFLVTDAAERFRRIAGTFLTHPVDRLELVDLS